MNNGHCLTFCIRVSGFECKYTIYKIGAKGAKRVVVFCKHFKFQGFVFASLYIKWLKSSHFMTIALFGQKLYFRESSMFYSTLKQFLVAFHLPYISPSLEWPLNSIFMILLGYPYPAVFDTFSWVHVFSCKL